MRLYVHALSDVPLAAWNEDDGRRLESVGIEGIFVIAERRDSVPPVTPEELKRQHAIVLHVAETVPAVIPARFGALQDEAELAAILHQRKQLIRTALEHVRGNVQMTLRMTAPGAPVATRATASGRDYLARRRAELLPSVPSRVKPLMNALHRFVIDERRKSDDRGMLAVYHLIRRAHVDQYLAAATAAAAPGISVSGPFAPFAFAPDLFA